MVPRMDVTSEFGATEFSRPMDSESPIERRNDSGAAKERQFVRRIQACCRPWDPLFQVSRSLDAGKNIPKLCIFPHRLHSADR